MPAYPRVSEAEVVAVAEAFVAVVEQEDAVAGVSVVELELELEPGPEPEPEPLRRPFCSVAGDSIAVESGPLETGQTEGDSGPVVAGLGDAAETVEAYVVGQTVAEQVAVEEAAALAEVESWAIVDEQGV